VRVVCKGRSLGAEEILLVRDSSVDEASTAPEYAGNGGAVEVKRFVEVHSVRLKKCASAQLEHARREREQRERAGATESDSIAQSPVLSKIDADWVLNELIRYQEVVCEPSGAVRLSEKTRRYRVAGPEDVLALRSVAYELVARAAEHALKEIRSPGFASQFSGEPILDWRRPLSNALVCDLHIDPKEHNVSERVHELNGAIRKALTKVLEDFDDGRGVGICYAAVTDASGIDPEKDGDK
jgi:hypothetical protein